MKEPKVGELKFSTTAAKKVKQAVPKLPKKARVKPSVVPRKGQHPISLLTRALSKGKFQKVPNTLVLTAGETLDLRCKGKAVKWRYPPYLEDDDVERRLR